MNAASTTALAIAVFGALCYAAASLLQAVAARRSHGTVQTMRHPLYLAGIACDLLAWVGAIIALRDLAVYVVESVLAGSLALTVIGARLILRSSLRRRDVAAVVVTLMALGMLTMSAGQQEEVAASAALRLWLCCGALVVALTGWGVARAGAPAGAVAAMAGLSLGGAALVGRALPIPAGLDALGTTWAIVTEPLTGALLLFAATGMMLYAHALQHGDVGPVTAVHWTFEVLTPSAIAVLFLGDTFRAGWAAPAVVAALVTVASAIVLATAPATGATHAPELPAAPAPLALPSAPTPAPALPAKRRREAPRERVIWWGPPPIWRPPSRAQAAALTAPPAQLTWAAAEPLWSATAPEKAGLRPWHDLS